MRRFERDFNIHRAMTHLDAFCIHFIILIWPSPIQTGIPLLIDQ